MISACCFDLECSNLCGDYGIILCGVVKPPNQPPAIIRADEEIPTWETQRYNDRPVVEAVSSLLQEYDLLVAFNGVRFDLPFLKTRLLYHKLPPFPHRKIIDPLQIARKHLRLSSNRLARISRFTRTPGKTRVDGETWMRAILDGCPEAMDKVVEHCVRDVELLEDLIRDLKPYCGSKFDAWGSA